MAYSPKHITPNGLQAEIDHSKQQIESNSHYNIKPPPYMVSISLIVPKALQMQLEFL